VRDSSVSVGPRVHSLNFLSPPMPASPPPAAETSSYYSNHYNRRCDAWRAIRLKTPKEVNQMKDGRGRKAEGKERRTVKDYSDLLNTSIERWTWSTT